MLQAALLLTVPSSQLTPLVLLPPPQRLHPECNDLPLTGAGMRNAPPTPMLPRTASLHQRIAHGLPVELHRDSSF